MNDIQEKLLELQARHWTLAAVADAVGLTVNAVEKWKAGDTYPRSSKAVMLALDTLVKRRPPKQRRYPGTHHLQRAKKEQERQDQV